MLALDSTQLRAQQQELVLEVVGVALAQSLQVLAHLLQLGRPRRNLAHQLIALLAQLGLRRRWGRQTGSHSDRRRWQFGGRSNRESAFEHKHLRLGVFNSESTLSLHVCRCGHASELSAALALAIRGASGRRQLGENCSQLVLHAKGTVTLVSRGPRGSNLRARDRMRDDESSAQRVLRCSTTLAMSICRMQA